MMSRQQFFANAGFPCPTMRNPSDHYLRTINSDFDNVHTILQGGGSQRQDIENSYSSFSNPMAKMTTAEQVKILVHLFETSDEKRAVSMRIEELKNEVRPLPCLAAGVTHEKRRALICTKPITRLAFMSFGINCAKCS